MENQRHAGLVGDEFFKPVGDEVLDGDTGVRRVHGPEDVSSKILFFTATIDDVELGHSSMELSIQQGDKLG